MPDEIENGEIEYEDLATEEPERDLDDDFGYEGGGFTEGEEEAGSISDFKALLRELNPKIDDPRIAALVRTARMSRIFPDNFLDKYGLTVAMLMMEKNPYETFNFVDLVNQVQDGFSFGFEGRGIADVLEAFSGVKEEEIEKLSKTLGF